MRGLVLAAGLGSRFKSEKPKVLHEILGKPMLWYVINNLRNGGVTEIGVVVSHKAEEVKKAFEHEGLRFFYQKNPKGGTADAVLAAKDFFASYEGYLVVLNGDSPLVSGETIKNMLNYVTMVERYEGKRVSALVLSAYLPDPTGYGRIIREEGSDRVLKIVEEKDATPEERAVSEVNAGAYVFWAPHLLEALFQIKPSPVTGELYLTDAVNYMAEKGYEVRLFRAKEPSEALGVNTRWELAVAESLIKLKLVRFWAERGVTFHLPETVWLEPEVSFEPDAEVFPGAVLKGKTKVKKGARIGEGALLVDATVEEGARVEPYSVVERSVVKKGAVVGPFARVRDGSTVGEGAHVGNFVEVKKSSVGPGVRAKHLAYIGDATLGKGVNVGAGVVFANYDGRQKHPTTVGDYAFIGSNALLVAPLKLGRYAFVAGGSVVTKDLPDYAFAIARPPLEVKEGLARKFLDIKEDES
ncbi:MAG: UDP-N-acetylglucosamine diphosphorylase/glucosamine-1-phosphate N-acetyltransferase [Aquificae bacterium]|nr:UDP-N-acetylglucosamine diphosphorylase/glucosamine-1-phosphate N-acetyltransferase [Aquificota bacterium]